MSVELRESGFDPWQALLDYQQSRPALNGTSGASFGATSVFVGTMRDFNEGDTVSAMRLEHYPAMTRKHLEAICAEAAQRWDIVDSLIIHRYGDIRPHDPIVLVAVWSAHRAESFPACRYLIEELKSRAPFWKQETTDDSTRWVEHNTPG